MNKTVEGKRKLKEKEKQKVGVKYERCIGRG